MSELFWTPHSGYHWNGSGRRFFEGWYLRVTLPVTGESVAFMYSIDDPAGNTALSGGAAQMLGPDETYLYCPLPDVGRFWAWRHRLGLGHWGKITGAAAPRYLSTSAFGQQVKQGYQVTTHHHQGCLQDAETGRWARWHYTVEPVYGWGPTGAPPRPTAGWLSYLPLFEPGWQVLMAHGWATGWMDWQGDRLEFCRAPVYAEKNWGGAFPERWFWGQCNAFVGEPDLSLTLVGGRRQVLNQPETVGLIGVHTQGQFMELSSLNGHLSWRVQPWGHWQVDAENPRYRIVVTGRCDRPAVAVRVPTRSGLRFQCWDTTRGHLTLHIWRRDRPGEPLTPLLTATSPQAGLEVGGTGWEQPWEFST